MSKLSYLRGILSAIGAESRSRSDARDLEEMETQDDYIALLARRIDEVAAENKELKAHLSSSALNISRLEHVVKALTVSHAQMATDMQIIYESVKTLEGGPGGLDMDFDDSDDGGGTGGMLN